MRKIAGTLYGCANIDCGRLVRFERAKPSKAAFQCKGTAPGRKISGDLMARGKLIASRYVLTRGGPHGPGTELHKLAEESGLGVACSGCSGTESKMNRLGVDGCRREIEALASEIVSNAAKQNVTITVEMARWAIDEACRRAEATAQQSPAQP